MRKFSSYIIGCAIGAIGFDDDSIILSDIIQRELEITFGVVGAGYIGNRAFGKGRIEYVDPASIGLGVLTGRVLGRYLLK